MKLSIVIPTHNEQATIAEVLAKAAAINIGDWEKEIIVVDDGSADDTHEILEKLQNQLKFSLIKHPKNLGKGAAIKSAIAQADGDYIIIQDADSEYDPKDIPKLLQAISSGKAVFGDRGTKRYPERGLHYVIGAKLLTWAVNILYGAQLKDLYTGYKLIPLNLLKSFNLESTGFEFEAEVACKILKAGYKISEVPIGYRPRNKAQGKHIGFVDALKGFWTIVKFRVK